MTREQFSQRIELIKLFHYALIPSYVDVLRSIASKPFIVRLIDINLLAESHIKSRIRLLGKYYVFLLNKAPSQAKSSDTNWLKESIASLEKFDQSLDSWLKLKSVILLFWPIIIGFLLSLYKSSNIYSLLLGLNISKVFVSFSDVAQFGLITMLLSCYSPFLGAFSYLYKNYIFDKHGINNKEKRIFSLFTRKTPTEIPYNGILFSFFLAINSFIILRTYILYGKAYLSPGYIEIFTWVFASFVILVWLSFQRDKTQKIQSIPFDNLKDGLYPRDFYYQIGLVKSLSAGSDLELRHEVTVNGRYFSPVLKVSLEDLEKGQITVTHKKKNLLVIPDIG